MNNFLFGEILRNYREQKKISQEELCEGLCEVSVIGKIENGERYPDKLMRDRLLGRIGETGFDYECFLDLEDYQKWIERREILDSLDKRELSLAEQLLEQYAKKNDLTDKLARQFWLTMRVQWLELKGEATAEQTALLEEAVKLTIPEVDEKQLQKRLLSVQELNLLLEYKAYKKMEGLEEWYQELLSYLEQGSFDPESMALLYSKTAYYYGEYLKRTLKYCKNSIHKYLLAEKGIGVCSKGIEYLRNHRKAYFAWEILQLQQFFLEIIFQSDALFSEAELEVYRAEQKQAGDFFEFFERYYTKYQVIKETNHYTFFYREHELYCINEVITARRKMTNTPRSDLEVLCGKRTIQRIESETEKTNMQLYKTQALFEYFGLSGEMQRAQIATNNQEVIRLEKQFRVAMNQFEYAEAEKILQQIKEKISMEDRTNRQYISYEETFLDFKLQKISKETFIEKAIDALAITIPYEAAMQKIEDVLLRNGRVWKGKKYLTNMEVTILTNLGTLTGNVPDNLYWRVLQEYYEKLEEKVTLSPILGMYGFVMSSVASYLGNMGQYMDANAINSKILSESLYLRNLDYVERNVYGIAWNNKELGLSKEKKDLEWKQALIDCITVDLFCKNTAREEKKRKRLEEL